MRAAIPRGATVQASKLRYIFWPFWFVFVPALLAFFAFKLIIPADPAGSTSALRLWVYEQQIPALIILFTIAEVLLYRWRNELPLAAQVGLVGRVDVPKAMRGDFEQAAHLVEEAARILKKHSKAVERAIPLKNREELSRSLDDLKRALQAQEFDATVFSTHYARSSQLVSQHLSRWRKSELREYGESILIAFLVALLLRAFVLEAFKIPSGSMLPTLQIQDHIFVNKFAYGPAIPWTKSRIWTDMPPKRGDVMVFEFPDPNPNNARQDYIKRVIAVPGDTLEVIGGHPIINGWEVPHCRVGEYNFQEGEGMVHHGELYMEFLGDYASHSSRRTAHVTGSKALTASLRARFGCWATTATTVATRVRGTTSRAPGHPSRTSRGVRSSSG